MICLNAVLMYVCVFFEVAAFVLMAVCAWVFWKWW